MRQFDVVVVGSANLDLVAVVDRLPQPGETVGAAGYAEHAGGKGLNQAVAAARMGARTAFVGCVGDDDAGRCLRQVLIDEGIDVSLLRTVGQPTGRALISVDRVGENSIVVVPGANAAVSPVEMPDAALVLLQLEIPLATAAVMLNEARACGSTTVLNPAPAHELPREVLESIDVMVPNEHEAAVLGGADLLLSLGVRYVVTTLGARGAQIASSEGTTSVDAYPVHPIDTVGAGDAFTGALCAMLAGGSSLEYAARIGVVAGALATTVRGAVPSLPPRDAVFAAVEGRPR